MSLCRVAADSDVTDWRASTPGDATPVHKMIIATTAIRFIHTSTITTSRNRKLSRQRLDDGQHAHTGLRDRGIEDHPPKSRHNVGSRAVDDRGWPTH